MFCFRPSRKHDSAENKIKSQMSVDAVSLTPLAKIYFRRFGKACKASAINTVAGFPRLGRTSF
jgi:hypothetical protein